MKSGAAITKAIRYWRYGSPFRARFGQLAGTAMASTIADAEYRRPTGELVPVHVPGWTEQVLLRAGSSDPAVFRQVLVRRELEIALLPAPCRIIDGGANFGLASLVFAGLWPAAQIVAIELERGNFELARRNCSHLPAIELRHAALWGSSGMVEVVNRDAEASGYRAGVARGAEGVRAYRLGELLDDLGWDTVDLVKLDIEGAERSVLEDAAAWLPRVGHLLVELHDRFEPGCTEAFESAIAGGGWDVRGHGEYTLASRRGNDG